MFNSTSHNANGDFYDWPAIRIAWNKTSVYGNRVIEACKVPSTPSQTVIDCSELEPRKLWLNLLGDNTTSTCGVTVDYVETEVSCKRRSCEAKRIRPSTQPHPSKGWTPLDVWGGSSLQAFLVSGLFLTNMANAVAGRNNGSGGGNALSGFIEDPANPFAVVANLSRSTNSANLQNVSRDLITSRITQFMNTYWTVSVGEQLITGTDDSYADAVKLTRDFGMNGPTSTRTYITASALATIGTPEEILQCDVSWLSILSITTLIGLMASASGLVLTVSFKGPRLSMYISTMVRDNKY